MTDRPTTVSGLADIGAAFRTLAEQITQALAVQTAFHALLAGDDNRARAALASLRLDRLRELEATGDALALLAHDAATAAQQTAPGTRRCRHCGCTDDDCTDCIRATGEPCTWATADECSRCTPPQPSPARQTVFEAHTTPPDDLKAVTDTNGVTWHRNGRWWTSGRGAASWASLNSTGPLTATSWTTNEATR